MFVTGLSRTREYANLNPKFKAVISLYPKSNLRPATETLVIARHEREARFLVPRDAGGITSNGLNMVASLSNYCLQAI